VSVNRDIDSVLGEYLTAADGGLSPDPQEYLRRFPHLRVALQEFFENDSWIGVSSEPVDTHRLHPTSLAVAPDRLLGQQLGHYQITGVIAKGGMGVVCRATHALLQREVAIKLLLAGVFSRDDEIQRIRCEAAAVARLDHPHIVPIYEVGMWEGQPFLVMPLMDFPDLQQIIASGPILPRQAAQWVRDLASAVEHAHRREVVHRDLKPSNVLVSPEGRAMLVDFGLAKAPRLDDLETASGQLLGTPHYMSPEQARGSSRAGPATDIFGLGGILYATLTGAPPHQGDSVMAILKNIFEKEIEAPRSPHFPIPSDLAAICMRCLSREPSDRYASAADLAADLQRFLDGEATVAGRAGALEAITRPLFRDTHRESFHHWGKWLLWFGAIIFLAHVSMFVLRTQQLPLWLAYLPPRVIMFGMLLIVLTASRGGQLRPRTTIERPIWSIWVGYVVALFAATLLSFAWDLVPGQMFALYSVLAGAGFFATGGQAWGGCYILGVLFMALSTVLHLLPAPELYFGGMWLGSLAILAKRYWQK
jgi:eukaryotic-like serine/threonine-protein kinase